MVLDLPPVNAVVDAVNVSRYVDGMLVVLREGHCPRYVLDECMEQLRYAKANVLGFVAPDLAALFADEPWLDLPPSSDAQADLLARLLARSRASNTSFSISGVAARISSSVEIPSPASLSFSGAVIPSSSSVGLRFFFQEKDG